MGNDTTDVRGRWDSLRAKLQAHAGALRCQGTLVEKTIAGQRYWYLRFYLPHREGKRIQKSVYVGSDAELVEKVRQFLAELREEEREYRRLKQHLPGVRRLVRWLGNMARHRPRSRAADPSSRLSSVEGQEEPSPSISPLAPGWDAHGLHPRQASQGWADVPLMTKALTPPD